MEEIWALLGNPHVARYYQACQKLSRTYGVANIAVSHRLEDFTAQTDDGTSTAKIGAGLVADTQTAGLFNLPPAQATEAADVFGLPAGAAHRLTQLGKGKALWKIGDHLTPRPASHHRRRATGKGHRPVDAVAAAEQARHRERAGRDGHAPSEMCTRAAVSGGECNTAGWARVREQSTSAFGR